MTDRNGFVWGAATARLPDLRARPPQTGAASRSGTASPATDGKVAHGDTGDPACEHYYRWADDLDLMRSLGLEGYRFSISWPRIQPTAAAPRTSAESTSTARSSRACSSADQTAGDALPLGPAAGARGRGRLGLARRRRAVHRVRADHVHALGDVVPVGSRTTSRG